MTSTDSIYLYRIIHIANLDYILKIGKLTCPNHANCDPDYMNIGDTTLIRSRSSREITVEPNGSFSDYVAFYFGWRSPMLYNIQKGFNGVTKIKPETIIYLVTSFPEVKNTGNRFVFTDGHAYHLMSQFYNCENDFKEVDWDTVKLVKWNDTEDDPDRKRRKQAEFLVYRELPSSSIIAVIVYNDDAKSTVLTKFAEHGFTCNIIINQNWYY